MGLVMIFLMCLISLLVLTLAYLLSMKKIEMSEKGSSFECGFNPMVKSRVPFSLHFFLVALIFIIFDLEIILLLPIPLYSYLKLIPLSSLMLFLVVLTVGLIYEWEQGSLNWI